MKRLLHILIALALTAPAAFAVKNTSEKKAIVEKPDMEKIQRDVNNPQSRYYFPKLMKAYEKNDTSMTLDQFRHLYLGYIFQEDYDPYRHSEFTSVAENLYFKEKHTKEECDTIIKYAQLSLKDDPFDLRQISFLVYAYKEKKKTHLAEVWQYKLNHLLEAILSTGTGLDKENAWIVNNPQHEYNILNFNNLIAESQSDEDNYDYITVKPKNPKDPKGYYFDVLYVLREYNRKFPDADD